MTDADDTPKRRMTSSGRDPAFEQALGARIQAARVAAKMSQVDLGAAIGTSYQQVQKYEKGKDRVAVSTLAAIAAALGVHPGSFFSDDMPVPRVNAPLEPRGTLLDLRSAQRIGESIERVGDPNVVRRLVALADAIADARHGQTSVCAATANGHAPDDAA